MVITNKGDYGDTPVGRQIIFFPSIFALFQSLLFVEPISLARACISFFVRLGILKLVTMYIYLSLLQIRKYVNLFMARSQIHSVSSRSIEVLDVPFVRLDEKTRSTNFDYAHKII